MSRNENRRELQLHRLHEQSKTDCRLIDILRQLRVGHLCFRGNVLPGICDQRVRRVPRLPVDAPHGLLSPIGPWVSLRATFSRRFTAFQKLSAFEISNLEAFMFINHLRR